MELFQLSTDIGEKQNLASRESERVAAMLKTLAAWRKDVGAVAATTNPNPNPKSVEQSHRRADGASRNSRWR